MTEVRIYATEHDCEGPEIFADYFAHIQKIEHGALKGVNSLRISIGDTDLRIWPADKDKIRKFGERLIEIADELEGKSK